MRKGHLAPIARDIQIASATLELFATSPATLPTESLRKLARYRVEGDYDAETGLLRPLAKPEVKPLGVKPDPIDLAALPKYTAGPGPGVQLPPAAPAPTLRPGWAEK
jgi:hypothetical protein